MRRSAQLMIIMALAVPTTFGALSSASATPAPAAPDSPAAQAGGELPRYDVVGRITGGDGLGPVGRGMNENGTIVGWVDWPLTAFQWDDETGMDTLPGLAGDTHRVAVDVNNAGIAVGHSGYETIEPPQHAVRWIDGVPDELDTPGLTDSHAEGINEAGTIVGWGYSGSDTHAFVWTEAGGMVDITPSAQFAYAYDVNESGQVTGYIGGQAFLWEDGVLTGLGAPEGFAYSAAFAINDQGVIAGQVTTASGNSERVARWSAETGWEVLGGAGETNAGWGINNNGTIVGNGRPSGGLERAVVYIEGFGLLSLAELLTTGNYFLLNAYDVDDAGRIVVVAHNNQTGDTETLLLAPVRPLMHDQDLRVVLRGSPDPSTGLAKLRVVDESGNPVDQAVVRGRWSLDGDVVARGDKDKTDAEGKAKLRHAFGELSTGQVVRFCVTGITHPDFAYDEPANPSCDSTTVP